MTTQENDAAYGDSSHEERAHSAAAHHRKPGSPVVLLFASGTLLWIGAIGLMTLPGLFPQYAWIFRHAAKHGVTSGPLVLIGLCLVGLGFIARALGAPKDEQTESEERLRFDQLATELVLLREGLDATRADVALVRATTQSALELAEAERANEAAENRQDAIFRLAASLDQVGARLAQRVQSQQTAIHGTLQELATSVRVVQEQIKELAAARTAGSPASQLMGRAMEMRQAHVQGISAERMSSATGVSSEQSLGLLDSLDDFGALQTKESPRLQLAGEPHARGLLDMDAPSPALPRESTNGEHAHHGSKSSANGAFGSHAAELDEEFSTRDKLELLRSLMDDARVREALGSLTGSSG